MIMNIVHLMAVNDFDDFIEIDDEQWAAIENMTYEMGWFGTLQMVDDSGINPDCNESQWCRGDEFGPNDGD
jgi:hypothetical protein